MTDPQSSNSVITFQERIGTVNLLSGTGQSIMDPDSTLLSRATLAITSRPDGLREILRLDPLVVSQLGVIADFNLAVGSLSLEKIADFETWLSILRAVQYVNTNQNPSDAAARRVSIVIRDVNGTLSEPVYVDIIVNVFNNPPELYLGGPGNRNFAVTFAQGDPCVPLVAPNVQLVDSDSNEIQPIRITISGLNFNTELERVDYNGTRPLGFTNFSGGALITTLPPISNYEAILRNLVYCNTDNDPNRFGRRTVHFTVTDTGLVRQSGRGILPPESSLSSTSIAIVIRPTVSFSSLNEVAITGITTLIINSSSIEIRDFDTDGYDLINIYITNPQDGANNELIVFTGQLPGEAVSSGPVELPGPQILYNVTFRLTADCELVHAIISRIRYINNATNATILPPREVCVEVRDQVVFSRLTCVNISLSLPNEFVPVFVTNVTTFNITETCDVSIVTLLATDADTGDQSSIFYSISSVRSMTRTTTEMSSDIFSINSMSGELTVPRCLNTILYTSHVITVVASDRGYPVRETTIDIMVNVLQRLVPPFFTGTPYLPSLGEELSPPSTILLVSALSLNPPLPGSNRISYQLLNHQDRFRIDSTTGLLESYQRLDADTIQSYILNVSATDWHGLTSFTTVTVSLTDVNDNPAVVDQRTPAVYVTNRGSSSIGPAIRISDADIGPPAITRINITLTFCSCGFEALVLPPLPPGGGVRAQVATNQRSILLEGDPSLIPNEAAVAVLRSINYTNQFDSPTTGDPAAPTSRQLLFTVTEVTGNIGSTSGTIVLVSSDDNPPVVDLNGIATTGFNTFVSYEVHGPPIFISPRAVVTRRIEGRPSLLPTFSHILVQLTNAVDDGEKLMVTGNLGALSIVSTNDNQTLEIMGPGLPTDFNSVLQDVQYANTNENPSISVQRKVSYIATDTGGRTNPVPATGNIIYFTSENFPPQLTLATDTVAYYQVGSLGVRLAPNFTITHRSNIALVSAEITITSPVMDILQVTPIPDITSTFNGSVLVINGPGSLSEYQTLLSMAMFSSTYIPSPDMLVESLMRNITMRVFDGQLHSNTVTVQVQFTKRNEPPVITLPSSVVTLRFGDTDIPIAPSARVTDPDNQLLQNFTVELEGTLDNHTLSSGNQTAPLLVYNQGTPAHFTSILRSITYINMAAKPSLLSRTINIEVCDFQECTNSSVTVEIEGSGSLVPIITASVAVAAIVLLIVIMLILCAVQRCSTRKKK